MNITIISAYTWYNKGDAAILLGTIKEVEEYFDLNGEKVNFNILTFTPEKDEKEYKKISSNIKNVGSNIFNPYPVKKTKLHKSIAMSKMFFQYLYLKIKGTFSKTSLMKNSNIKLVEDADLVIVCGGGFLGGNKYNSLMHLAQIDILSSLNKKFVLWGTSIEPPRKRLLRYITEQVLKNMSFILPREDVTLKYLKDWYPEDQIIQTPDMAFKLGYNETEEIKDLIKRLRSEAKEKKIIGITMRDWFFPKSLNPVKARENYENALVNLINDLETEALFVFIPQVIMTGDDDRLFASLIKERINNDAAFIVLESDYSPHELKYLISKCDQFLGTRMHSNIFSSSIGLSPVAIAYEKKTNGIMHELGLDDYVIDIENVSVNDLKFMLENNKVNQERLNIQVNEQVKLFHSKIRQATKEIFKHTK